ncbi:MAG: beta-galactosidase [Rhodobacteraceae bacterium]|nr:beta-galactosidase [Paracoccaceae bacterium]
MTAHARSLGCCYYPEHWSPQIWQCDAEKMVKAGLTWVRIGEFAWSRLEPQPGQYDWCWLDRAIDILGSVGLKVVLSTPTATPPRWIVDQNPDMLAVDTEGRPRKFGARRHYCFSHLGYRVHCARIVTELAARYAQNPYIAAWQTDNEYGCHDTTISYSAAARSAFQTWLRNRYRETGRDSNDGDITALNTAWGNVFWSMEYGSFEQIDLPNLTVTEANPSHHLDFRRFTSDQVVSFNKLQADIIRRQSPAPIAHNYMGRITDFDHFDVGADLDIASWDSYPLGFLEDRITATEAYKKKFARQGDPDFQAFHHDLYRAVGRGRWWVMEQQPGPVNWAPYNPAPLPGMVRLWTWEAFAHGAEAVCYFRWRQVPFAQEQMHSGLLNPDSSEAPGLTEARRVADEIVKAPAADLCKAPVAIVFDYDADFSWSIQPHGQNMRYFDLVFESYRAARALGLSVDIVPPDTRDLTDYKLILVPGMMHMPKPLKANLASCGAAVIIGPRSACRTQDMQITLPLPPDLPGFDAAITQVESLRPNMGIALEKGGYFQHYFEQLTGTAEVSERTSQGQPAMMREGRVRYLAGWPDPQAFHRILATACTEAEIVTRNLPEGLRLRETATEQFWFNYAAETQVYDGKTFAPASVLRDLLPTTPNP